MTPTAIAFTLTLLAGLATGIGSAIAFFAKRTNATFLAVSLGFSAGVMIYVSFVEIMPTARDAIVKDHSPTWASWVTAAGFFAGILIIALLDKAVPENTNPHEVHKPEDYDNQKNKKLMRTGLMTAAALAIHNFPEGFATFLSGLQDPSLAIPVAVAIAIHNIPEGIAVSVPVYYATGSRKKGFWLSFASGLSEPLGALIGWLVLRNFLTDTVFGVVFAAVAGIMVFISFDELLPTAEEYGEHHHAIYGLIAGMAAVVTAFPVGLPFILH